MNTDVWNRIAGRDQTDLVSTDVVLYAPGGPTESELRLLPDVLGKRVLDIGTGGGANAVALARLGAHVIAIDRSDAQLGAARQLATATEVRVEWHESDAADLAFLRADSIDLVLATGVVGEVEDLDRLLRQVHRVLRPGAAFVFSYDHPMGLAVGPKGAARRSYFDPHPVETEYAGERIRVFPRTIADVFSSLHRAGYRVEQLLEPDPDAASNAASPFPRLIVWRARKEGV